MNITSICGCLELGFTPEPYPYTHPIRPNMNSRKTYIHDINSHELTCEKAQLIRDEILSQQNLDSYPVTEI